MAKKIFSKLLLVIGLLLCFYPLVAGMYDSWLQSQSVSSFASQMHNSDAAQIQEIIDEAHSYNDKLFSLRTGILSPSERSDSENADYNAQLNFSVNGMMGSLEIPKIGVNLPIYHGTDESVLAKNVGHLQGSSLPVGGSNTRAVLTAHRGLPTAKLFTRLDEMEKGDQFFLKVGNETLAYEVRKIEVITPDDADQLDPVEGKDMVTLLTCTPYGINTHRLLVTGERVPYVPGIEETISQQGPSWREVLFAALPFLLLAAALYKPIKKYIRNKKGE